MSQQTVPHRPTLHPLRGVVRGYERGAFTGATERHIGAFERGNGGTILLDEVGELPSALQPNLLGALERRSFRRLGSRESISVDVRVVCATNRDLRREVNEGRFRQDLYDRIAVLTMAIPPLRGRREDIPLLIQHFLGEMGLERAVEEIVPELEVLMAETRENVSAAARRFEIHRSFLTSMLKRHGLR